jgi:hypothetical protein
MSIMEVGFDKSFSKRMRRQGKASLELEVLYLLW